MEIENKDKLMQYRKDYYAKNKDAIKNKLKTRETCPHCNAKVRHQYLKKHQVSAKCVFARTEKDMFFDISDITDDIIKNIIMKIKNQKLNHNDILPEKQG